MKTVARSIPYRMRLIVSFAFLLTISLASLTTPTHATKYGSGSYGRCQYETCSISMSSSANVSLNVVPTGGTPSCTVSKDTVTVTTSSSTGYKLLLSDADSTTTLISGSNSIATTTATYASPATLGANKWGYRVDGVGTFGAGPTSAQSNATTPSATYAGLQPSTGTADTITTSTSAASSGAATSIWYGLCINASVPSGTYSDGVLYTAVIN